MADKEDLYLLHIVSSSHVYTNLTLAVFSLSCFVLPLYITVYNEYHLFPLGKGWGSIRDPDLIRNPGCAGLTYTATELL